MPLAVSSGSAGMTVPVRTSDGKTEVRSVAIDLAPQERQMDLSVSYQVPMSESSELMVELVHATNYGNVAGATDSAAVLGMKWVILTPPGGLRRAALRQKARAPVQARDQGVDFLNRVV